MSCLAVGRDTGRTLGSRRGAEALLTLSGCGRAWRCQHPTSKVTVPRLGPRQRSGPSAPAATREPRESHRAEEACTAALQDPGWTLLFVVQARDALNGLSLLFAQRCGLSQLFQRHHPPLLLAQDH